MTVQVSTNHITFNAGQATDVDVLTGLGNQSFAGRFLISDQRSSVGVTSFKRLVQAGSNECLEVILQSQEVGLGVDFDDDCGLVVGSNLDGDGAFSGDIACFFGCLDGAGSAHVVNRLLDITFSGNQSLFALHHALTGTLAQFFDQCCSNFCHGFFLT